ncbi:hypothetical protein GCM10022394_08680 [Zobellella aerophila]|uniref:Uncharacterized protein n=1 Tax=Zobellella aerophila TaxID=870480 RepID=A0ABP6V9U5_9GAMM
MAKPICGAMAGKCSCHSGIPAIPDGQGAADRPIGQILPSTNGGLGKARPVNFPAISRHCRHNMTK